jgi:hypothetical protein
MKPNIRQKVWRAVGITVVFITVGIALFVTIKYAFTN